MPSCAFSFFLENKEKGGFVCELRLALRQGRPRHRHVPKFPTGSNTTLLNAGRVSTCRRGPGDDENLAERSPSEHVCALRGSYVEGLLNVARRRDPVTASEAAPLAKLCQHQPPSRHRGIQSGSLAIDKWQGHIQCLRLYKTDREVTTLYFC
jgi:hypothetical protein